jgi:DMSO/TMAO reductase YedYZ molybdopterin-dependent catalytic subunit
MLLVTAFLRWTLGFPTVAEMIFDRAFPLITIDFFIRSIVWAGGYAPLKLDGVYGALGGQLAVAALAGGAYALYMGGQTAFTARRRAAALLVPGVAIVWVAFVIFLWPTLITQYRGVPPPWSRPLSALGLLIDFAACAVGIAIFHAWLLDPAPRKGVPEGESGNIIGRRAFLFLGTAATLSVLLGTLLHRLFRLGTFSYDGKTNDAPGVEPITSNRRFYSVTKNIIDPDVNPALWRLEVAGQVQRPRSFSLGELKSMAVREQETTLMCISNPVGGGLISNARWTGVPLPEVLRSCGADERASALLFHAADGYYETIPMTKALEQTTLLAWAMNGEPLPRIHGAPLRMITPGLYGEKNPKWLTQITVLAEGDPRLIRRHGCGFYKEQGWGPNFTIPTMSRIDEPLSRNGRFLEPLQAGQAATFSGIAFGGDRSISAVELSFDREKSWQRAELTVPGTKISWSRWRTSFTPAVPGELVVAIRAVDGTGALQIAQERSTVPQGATGLQRLAAKVV